MLKRILLTAALAAGCAWGEDVQFYYVPLVPSLNPVRIMPASRVLDGIGVEAVVADGADAITITVSYSVDGKTATATRTVGQPDNLPWMTGERGAWFPLWDHAATVSNGAKINSIAVSVTRGSAESSKTVTSPVFFREY